MIVSPYYMFFACLSFSAQTNMNWRDRKTEDEEASRRRRTRSEGELEASVDPKQVQIKKRTESGAGQSKNNNYTRDGQPYGRDGQAYSRDGQQYGRDANKQKNDPRRDSQTKYDQNKQRQRTDSGRYSQSESNRYSGSYDSRDQYYHGNQQYSSSGQHLSSSPSNYNQQQSQQNKANKIVPNRVNQPREHRKIVRHNNTQNTGSQGNKQQQKGSAPTANGEVGSEPGDEKPASDKGCDDCKTSPPVAEDRNKNEITPDENAGNRPNGDIKSDSTSLDSAPSVPPEIKQES